MESIWKKSLPTFPYAQEGKLPKKVEVAIIGGGMCGILTALLLQEHGVSCAIFEANEIGSGQTGNTTAKITCQQGLRYANLEKKSGERNAALWAASSIEAIHAYEKIAAQYEISCQMERLPSLLYTQQNERAIEEESYAARRAGIHAELRRHTSLPFSIALALSFPAQAQFHPLYFLYGVARHLKIWQGVRICKSVGHSIYTDEEEEIEAQKIVWACHYPAENFPGMYFTRLHQSRSYALALKGVPPLHGMYYGIDPGALSFRTAQDTLILVGSAHRTGKPNEDPYAPLLAAANKYYPNAPEIARWSAQDVMSSDALPLAGCFSVLTPDLYLATGFSKWGMTGAMISAQIICSEIIGEHHPAAGLCAPGRFGFSELRTLAKESTYVLEGLGKRFLNKPAETSEELAPGTAGIVLHKGRKRGVYRAPDGSIYSISPVCTHLGCELKWNPHTLTWDCPCHGSRFSYDGTALDAPATSPLHTCPCHNATANIVSQKKGITTNEKD